MTNINNLGARLNNNINSIGNNANQWHVLAQNDAKQMTINDMRSQMNNK